MIDEGMTTLQIIWRGSLFVSFSLPTTSQNVKIKWNKKLFFYWLTGSDQRIWNLGRNILKGKKQTHVSILLKNNIFRFVMNSDLKNADVCNHCSLRLCISEFIIAMTPTIE